MFEDKVILVRLSIVMTRRTRRTTRTTPLGRRSWRLCLLVGLGAGWMHAQQLPPAVQAKDSTATPAPGDVATATRLLKEGHGREAATSLRAFLATHPDDFGAQRLLAVSLFHAGQVQEAEPVLHKALLHAPDDLELVQLRGLALYRLGRPVEAIPLLEQLRAKKDLGHSDVNYILGLCYTGINHFDEARASFARQYGLDPASASAYLLAGQLLLRAHLSKPAEEAGRKALALDPKLPLTNFLLGEIALGRYDLKEANLAFERERTLNPAFARTYDRLGDTFLRAGQFEDAQAALNQAIILDPLSTGPYILLGKVALKRADPGLAAMYLRRAETMDPGNYMTHALLGQALRGLGQTAEAARETQRSVEIQEHTETPQALQTPADAPSE